MSLCVPSPSSLLSRSSFPPSPSGLDNAGKTTILRRIHGDPIDEIAPTLGFNIKTLNHEGYSINVWDVGGQKSLRSFWRNYFESTDAVIWVVDAADRARLADCKEELFVLLQEEVCCCPLPLPLLPKGIRASRPGTGSLRDPNIHSPCLPPSFPQWILPSCMI